LNCPIEWHGGFTLTTAELRRHPEYRGHEFVRLGMSLARDGRLDPCAIGDASRTGHHDEQALKRVALRGQVRCAIAAGSTSSVRVHILMSTCLGPKRPMYQRVVDSLVTGA
jgi:hypothetical protein